MRLRPIRTALAGLAVAATALVPTTGTALAADDPRLSQITARSGTDFTMTADFGLTSYANALANKIGADTVHTVLTTANRSTNDCNTSRRGAQPEYYARTDIPLPDDALLHSVDRFCWEDDDSANNNWAPQGVTGSSDADDDGLWDTDRAMVVSWHYSATNAGTSYDKGARVSLVDRTTGKYRHVLLVEPTRTSTPNFKAVGIHAGGIAWLGKYLFVTDTSVGIRVFDMSKFLWVDASQQSWVGLHGGTYYGHGFSYVLPQIGVYRQVNTPANSGGCVPTTTALCYASLTLDRSTTPDTLVVGEYRANVDTANPNVAGGRVVRYPVAADTRLLTLTSGKAVPYDAVTSPKSNVQGVQTWNGAYYQGRSSASKHSFMYAGRVGGTAISRWSWAIGGEDLYHEHSGTGGSISAGKLWTATEHYLDENGNVIDKRIVFAVPLAEIVPGS
ncbi:hypothetical protein [Goodfellowiella coeruleoviolacea]|uniref:Secreted protein n=1 Tax=Goodfellowiella coeruleoviolacea TaxID=334858 RepID=A0AAE3GHM3_9PSEU|nr:hypothetical protein [Goodfellowiella coeruleoviolacea]MCP2166288.1 hypothetical protein [Goodfellowiella coeruleoviolacea]